MAEKLPKDKPAKCDELVIECMENRFHEANREFLAEKYGFDLDEVVRLSWAGAYKGVVDGALIPQIEKAAELKAVKNITMVGHTDCGGFGSLEAFGGNENKEAAAQFATADRAIAAISKVLPNLLVRTHLLGLDGQEITRADSSS